MLFRQPPLPIHLSNHHFRLFSLEIIKTHVKTQIENTIAFLHICETLKYDFAPQVIIFSNACEQVAITYSFIVQPLQTCYVFCIQSENALKQLLSIYR